ncbi:unnamed protein product [Cercopithifilaria johnstoni]|uniref:Uncharacterized protein n=1 Tax=Cercopithifilaria johnstoni TaxID=2874296 RepID=A0A8J2M0V2_9BILA|nr:unnamed protein product [Cercopithifilaria johnstoni]
MARSSLRKKVIAFRNDHRSQCEEPMESNTIHMSSTALNGETTGCTENYVLIMGPRHFLMRSQTVRMPGSSWQSEGEVLDWTVRSDRTGGGVDRRGWWVMSRHSVPSLTVRYCSVAWCAVMRSTALSYCSATMHNGSGIAGGQVLEILALLVTCGAGSSATTVSAAKKRCMQQQHSAAASNSGLSAAVPTVEPTTVTVVDRLKHQLLQAYDNGDTEQATDVIIKLEKSNLTKELLEGEGPPCTPRSVRRLPARRGSESKYSSERSPILASEQVAQLTQPFTTALS